MDTKPGGEINLTRGSTVKKSQERAHALELCTSNAVLIMCAESPESQNDWIFHLSQALHATGAKYDSALGSSGSQRPPRPPNNNDTETGKSEMLSPGTLSSAAKALTSNCGPITDTRMGETSTNVARGKRTESLETSDVPLARFNFGARTGTTTREEPTATQPEPTSCDYQKLAKKSSTMDEGAVLFSEEARAPERKTHKISTSHTVFEVDERYSFDGEIGSGAYGFVISAKDEQTNEKVAIKMVANAFDDLIDAKRVLREIKLLRHFNHANIINIRDLILPQGYNEFNHIYIVSDLMETDLGRVIYSKQVLTDTHVKTFLYQMLRALKYIHSANVIHRDIKPQNLLVNLDCNLKVCDFGLARGLEGSQQALTEYVVTRWYRAPEILLGVEDYSKAVDVWAVGCVLAELLLRKPLFHGQDTVDQLQLIIKGLGTPTEADMDFIASNNSRQFLRHLPSYPKIEFTTLVPNAGADGADLLKKLLTFNPDHRLTAEEALSHPYLSDPYLAPLHQPKNEPICSRLFIFDDNQPDERLVKLCIMPHQTRALHLALAPSQGENCHAT